MNNYKGFLFDLDGVLVDTAQYHYLAWEKLADSLGIPFDLNRNELLKGVSRMRSLEIILDLGNLSLPEDEKERLCEEKNSIYISYIQYLNSKDLLPGVRAFLTEAKKKGYKLALGSASKNSMMIIEKLCIRELFDAIIDGTTVSKAKPDPEVFLRGAENLGLPCECCIVFEDAVAGVQAAHAAGMKVVGVGKQTRLQEADLVISNFTEVSVEGLINQLAVR